MGATTKRLDLRDQPDVFICLDWTTLFEEWICAGLCIKNSTNYDGYLIYLIIKLLCSFRMIKCCVMSGDTASKNLDAKFVDSEYYLIEEGDSPASKCIR